MIKTSIIKNMHIASIASNLFYFIPGIFLLLTKNNYKILGVLLILTTISSCIHHRLMVFDITLNNKIVKPTKLRKLLALLDEIFAHVTFVYCVYLLIKKGVRNKLFIYYFIILIISVTTLFSISYKYWKRVMKSIKKKKMEYTDVDIVLYNHYHSYWHVVGGIMAMISVYNLIYG